MDIEEQLKQLDVLQISILFWKQRGLTDIEIGSKFNYGEDWVQARMTEIYKSLGFDPKIHWRQKTKELEKNYLPVVRELTNDDPDNTVDWPSKAKTLGKNRPKASPPISSNKNVDQQGTKPASSTESVTSVDQNRPTRRSIWTWLWIPILILVIGGLFGAFWLGRTTTPQLPVPTAVTVLSENTQVATVQPSAIPTEAPTEAIEPPTLEVSDTPQPSDTPTPSPVPTQAAAFFDDFEDGLDPGWTVVYGSPAISNGQLQAGEQTLLAVGDPSWTNYQVEFDLRMAGYSCQDSQASQLGVRASDADNMLLLRFHPCETEWSSVINGKPTIIPGTFLGNQGFSTNLVHFVVRVEGDKITFHEKSTLLNSFINSDHPSGYIYLRVRPGNAYDNFKVTLLDQ